MRRLLVIYGLTTLLAGCGGNIIIGGMYFAPWLGFLAIAAVVAFPIAQVVQKHWFKGDPRYFVWLVLPLTILLTVLIWFLSEPP